MSYDLFFHPRDGQPRIVDYLNYFRATPHFKVDAPQALYEHEDTGVYFVFEVHEEPEEEGEEFFPVSLNLNYFRPSFFGMEAEPQITAFVRKFDMLVSDPQREGMGEGEYSPELFLRGWNCGNEFGYRAILENPANREGVAVLPSQKLTSLWKWNLSRNRLQDKLGKSIFVPRICVASLAGTIVTAAIWPDAIPIAVPEVDVLLVVRKNLASRNKGNGSDTRSILPWSEAAQVLGRFWSARAEGPLLPNYSTPPAELRKFVESLPTDIREVKILASDKVLDKELVEKYS